MITKHFAPASPSFPDSLFFLSSLSQWCRRTGDGQLRVRSWSVWNISFQLPSSPHSCPASAWSPLRGIQSLLSCFKQDPPLAGVVLQEETVPAWIPHGPHFLPETCFCMSSLGCSFLQGSSIHLLSVGAPRLPLCVSLQRAPWWVAGGEPASPFSKTTERLSCTTAVTV